MSKPSDFFGGSINIGSSKNLLINGNFDVWQRGTTATDTTNGYYTADRYNTVSIDGTETHSRQAFTIGQTDVPNNPDYYFRNVITSGVGTTGLHVFRQRIENVTRTSGETLTYSFWAKADSSKDISVELLQNFGTGGSDRVDGIGPKKFSLTTNWQKITGTITMPSILGKTVGGDSSTEIMFWLEAGSDYDSRTVSIGHQSGTFDVAQVQLEFGDEVTDFEHRTYGEELALCQRYFEMSFSQGVLPQNGPNTTSFSIESGVFSGVTYNSVSCGINRPFLVEKRSIPSMKIYGNSQGYGWYSTGATQAWSASCFSFYNVGTTGFGVVQQQVNNVLITVRGHWAADAEL